MPFDYGEEIVSWEVPEYEKPERNKNWYYIAISIVIIFLSYSLYTTNFLFGLIIIISTIIFYIHDHRNPDIVEVSLTTEGISVGRKFHDFDEIKDFSVVYKPHYGVENLYFEFKDSVKHRLSIPLFDTNPLPIRENLLKYLPEDLERTDAPDSEGLARLLKL